MDRQALVNAAVGGFFGLAAASCVQSGMVFLGICVFVMWIVGMVNLLMPSA